MYNGKYYLLTIDTSHKTERQHSRSDLMRNSSTFNINDILASGGKVKNPTRFRSFGIEVKKKNYLKKINKTTIEMSCWYIFPRKR